MTDQSLHRSPEALDRDNCVLLIVDMQDRILDLIDAADTLRWNASRLSRAARLCGVPIVSAEQNPDKLGRTTPSLAEFTSDAHAKLAFSCLGSDALAEQLRQQDRQQVVVAGIEAHVCVLQTALDLLAAGYVVHLTADAIGGRLELDRELALRRLESSGAVLTSVETVLFEWCREAGNDLFRGVSKLVRETRPGSASDGE